VFHHRYKVPLLRLHYFEYIGRMVAQVRSCEVKIHAPWLATLYRHIVDITNVTFRHTYAVRLI